MKIELEIKPKLKIGALIRFRVKGEDKIGHVLGIEVRSVNLLMNGIPHPPSVKIRYFVSKWDQEDAAYHYTYVDEKDLISELEKKQLKAGDEIEIEGDSE